MIYTEIIKAFENAGAALQSVEGELFYNPSDLIPEHCIGLAKEYKTRIIAILDGKDLTQQWKRDNLFIQAMYFYRNVADKSNDRIEEWMNADQEAAALFMKLTTEYENCGWQNIEEMPFNLENDTTKELAEALYQNALKFFKKERVAS